MSKDGRKYSNTRDTEPVLSPSSPPPSAQQPSDGIVEETPATTVDGVPLEDAIEAAKNTPAPSQHRSLKHHLLGPSLTKAGQDKVDQKKVAEVIYEASKGSKYFNNEEVKDKNLTAKIERILKLKAQLEKLDLKNDLKKADTYIAELELSRDLSQYVVHIDCDAFYAAVEEIDHPELKNVPMAVGQGVLTTCNYEARKFGCRSAMAGFVAKKLCPQLVCLPLNFEKYTAKAKEVRAVLAIYDPRFESSSIDEAYLNVTEYCEEHDIDPETAITQLRQQVHDDCKITISAGIAPNAKIAKICSNKNKPNGQFRIPNNRVAVVSFMRDLPVRKVNGIGRVLERELDAIGVKTCGDIYEHRMYLNRLFGDKTTQFLLQTYLGLGRTDVSPADDHERKSVGTESTFREMDDPDELRAKLRHTAEELEKDMKRVGVKGRTLVLKIKLHTYEVFTRQISPPKAVSQADDLYNFSVPMLAKLEKEIPGMKLRLMGLRCTHLIDTKRPDVEGFFNKKHYTSSAKTSGSNSEGEWEVWPDAEFENAERQEREEEFAELERLSQEQSGVRSTSGASLNLDDRSHELQVVGSEPFLQDFSTSEWHEPFGHYKYGSAPNKKEEPTALAFDAGAEGERWCCPVCSVPQPADDRTFNEHIDSCLSKSTIRDTITELTDDAPSRPVSVSGTKRKPLSRSPSRETGSKQRKLFFT